MQIQMIIICISLNNFGKVFIHVCFPTFRLYDPEWALNILMKGAFVPGIRLATMPVFWFQMKKLRIRDVSTIDIMTAMVAQFATRYWDTDQAPKWFEQLRQKGTKIINK